MSILPAHLRRWDSVTPISYDPTQRNNTDEYRGYSAKRAFVQRFAFDLRFVKHRYDLSMELYAFLMSQGGTHGIWTLPNPMPQIGSASTGIQARASSTQGSTQLLLKGLPPSLNGAMRPGDFIRPSANAKCYMVQNLVNSNSTGLATAQVYPSLYHDVTTNEFIEFGSNVQFQVRLESDMSDIQISVSNSRFADPNIEVVEVG